MLFNSLTFVVFFAIVLALHAMPFGWKIKKTNLLIASYLFYAAWNPPFVALLWLSTVIDWFAGKALHNSNNPLHRRLFLAISLASNLGLLAFFKYGGFMLENFVSLVNLAGIDYTPAAPNIILPMGISFYTFQTITYTFDIYRRQLKPAPSFLDYALYVTFFPQLVAGPIVRATQFNHQLLTPRRATRQQLLFGLWLMTLGLFQKIVIADGFLAEPAEAVFGATASLYTLDAWIGVLAFSGQIFCDFAGYSTCAIGAALCLGFSLPNNFLFPYAAIGFSDFWRRWHISLSTWLRDYLYIPMGGNRAGVFRTYRNLMVTMLLGGLWHGASWTFVAWGGLHGLYLCTERFLAERSGHVRFAKTIATQIVLALLTFVLVNITWVFFRAHDFATAGRILASMFAFAADGAKVLPYLDITKVLVVIVGLLGLHWLLRNTTHEQFVARMPWWSVSSVWAIMLILIIIRQGGSDAFIYFQF